jgi:type II secretory pathway component PulF
MSDGERGVRPPGPITLDQLLALNEEIAALVRAGVPLDRGLLEAGRDVRGRLGRVAGVLGRRLNRGESLIEALESEARAIPPLYRAVVEAGTRAGQLPVALEGMARYVRGLTDARTAIGMALWYPGLVVCLAYGLFVGLVWLVVPRFVAAFDALGLATSAPLRWLEWAGGSASYWWPVGPIVIVVLAIAWVRSGTAAGLRGGAWSGLRLFPWMGSLLADYEAASFAELLALLLEHRVPYPSAMVLAADATGAPRLALGARWTAEAIARGEPVAAAVDAAGPRAFPPMLRWTLSTGQAQGSLGSALRHMAGLYRKRARYRAEQLALFLPMILTVAIGAGAAAFYGLSLFLPLIEMLRGLSAG